MNSSLLIGISAVLLLVGTLYPSFGQSSQIADHLVINEIEINPPGDDSKTVSEWIELYNPTDKQIDIGGWTISSTTVLKKTLTLPQGTVIKPGSFLAYSHVKLWFTDVSERVELRNAAGILVDQTPEITDIQNDFKSWQRIYDGYDTDSFSDWKFVTSNAGSTNGKLITEKEIEKAKVTVSLDKDNYLFGQTAKISGDVSERVFIEKPYFQPEKISIKITGPSGYFKNINLYPDFFLKYKTELGLQKVLDVKEGRYFVTVEYAGSMDSTEFTVGDEIIVLEEAEQGKLSITTDKESYIPGQTAKIIASTSEIIPFEGLKFKVINPSGKQIFDGTLYPNPKGEFSTTIFLTTVSPSYGPHQILADYGPQKSSNLFEVSKDVKEDKLISLRTDKTVYGLGETVIITGRLNLVFVDTLDLEILQTGIITADQSTDRLNKVLDAVRPEGDSTFKFNYKIPNNFNSYGEYRVTVSKNIGKETLFFKVVPNPQDFITESQKPFTITTDKSTYESGDPITFSGKINQLGTSSQYYAQLVKIDIKRSEGTSIVTSATKPSGFKPSSIIYSLTAIPDIVGNYKVKDTVRRAIYDVGSYVVTANYGDGLFTDKTSFSVIDPLKIEGFANINLDKQVYGLGEEVHLSGLISRQTQGVGITITLLKPSGDTDKFGTLVDNGKFSWTWKTPISEKQSTIKSSDDRSNLPTNLGIYRVTVASDTYKQELFFQVSDNPSEDSLAVTPITVTTEKPVYNAGEKLKVKGLAMKRVQGQEGLVVPERVQIIISTGTFPFEKIYESFVYLGPGGDFETLFEMPVTIFKGGTYKVVASYLNNKAENIFKVDSTFLTDASATLSLLINLDKNEYYPGEIVHITARPSKIIFPDFIRLGIPSDQQTSLNCGSFVCGKGVPINEVRISPDGVFRYDHKIPMINSIGTFVVTFDTEFGTFKKPFTVVEKPIEIVQELKPLTDRVLEKFNRIPESFIPIIVEQKIINETQLHPRVIQGSLFAPERGQESNVNLKVSTQNGDCIIGQEAGCKITGSTRIPGSIYNTIEIDGKDYKVRYSGPDVTLEKFTILPESVDDTLPGSTWNVDIIKEEQSSRFYYKVSYIVVE